jgi:predicted RNA-binding Zn ribbon-like protein
VTVLEAVERDLDRLRGRDAELAESALAASAVALAREVDSGRNSATSKSMCARELREVMDRLWELAPEKMQGDGLDELNARRTARRSAA